MPEEIRFFVRTALFGGVLGLIYWVVSNEAAGTILLLAFGLAGAFLAIVIVRLLRGQGRRVGGAPWRWLSLDPDPSPPVGNEPRRYPTGSIAPLTAGLGLSVAAMGAIYGPAFIVGSLPLLLGGALMWLRAANVEWRANARDDADDGAEVLEPAISRGH